MSGEPIRVEVNGRDATAGQLRHPAMSNYAHFTAMQVRGGRTRGLGLHLARLDAANRELFDVGLDTGRVRDHLRHALTGVPDASVRVIVFRPDADEEASVLVAVQPPADPPAGPQRLMSVPYQRPAAHLKHTGGFGQAYYGRMAQRAGFDDALLTGPGGVISEAAISNVAFADGTAITWPDAPSLSGITMRLLEQRLAGPGLTSRRGPVRLADLPSYSGVLVTNTRGIAPVSRIDDAAIPVDPDLVKAVTDSYESVPWDPI